MLYKYKPIRGSGCHTSTGLLQPEWKVRYFLINLFISPPVYLFENTFNTLSCSFFRNKNAVINIRSTGNKCLQDAITCGMVDILLFSLQTFSFTFQLEWKKSYGINTKTNFVILEIRKYICNTMILQTGVG